MYYFEKQSITNGSLVQYLDQNHLKMTSYQFHNHPSMVRAVFNSLIKLALSNFLKLLDNFQQHPAEKLHNDNFDCFGINLPFQTPNHLINT